MKKIIIALLGLLLFCGCQQKVDIYNLDDSTDQNYVEVTNSLKDNDELESSETSKPSVDLNNTQTENKPTKKPKEIPNEPEANKSSSTSNKTQVENKPTEKPEKLPAVTTTEQPKDDNEYQVGDVIQTESGNNLKYNGKIEKEDGTLGDSWTMVPSPDYEVPDTEKVVKLEDGTRVTQEVINAGWEAPEDLPDGAVFVGEAEISDIEDFLNAQN